ncbi:MAG: tetratricopeptide repeat protein [Calditrichales bacterium]|nr:MAG: tetratricopeptide repeat protein [Calditrichales bacterium]
MRKFISLVLIVLMSLAMVYAQNSGDSKSPEAGNAYNDGLDQARKGNFDAAIPLFEKAIKADEHFAQAYYMLGLSQKRVNKNTSAINSFKKAIEIDKKFENSYIALGNLQTDLEDFDPAINTFNAVLSFNDKSSKAYYGVGNIFFKQRNYEKAIEVLKKSVQYSPDYDLAWNILGLSQDKANQLTDAAASFEGAINATSNRNRQGNYYFRLGNVLLRLKKYKSAEDAYLNALKFSKTQSVVGGSNFGLGEVYKFLGQTQKAIEYYKKASKERSWRASADYEIDLLQNPDKYVN